MFTQWAFKGQLPTITEHNQAKYQPLLWQQVKDQMLLEASWLLPAGFANYTLTETIALEYYDLQETRLDYRD